MKYFLTFILFTSFFLKSHAESPTLLFSLSDSNLARIGVINKFDYKLKLKIESEDGNTIFNEKINEGERFFKFYDLSELPEGKYFIELKGKDVDEVKIFIIKNGLAYIEETPGTKEPSIKIENNRLYVSLDNQNRNGISLIIRDHNTVLYQELAIHDSEINKSIQLDDLPEGKYTLTVKTAKKLYNYDFSTN